MCSTTVTKDAFALRNGRAPKAAECSPLSRIVGMLTAAHALIRRRLSCTFHPRLKLFPIPQSKIWDRQEHRNRIFKSCDVVGRKVRRSEQLGQHVAQPWWKLKRIWLLGEAGGFLELLGALIA